MAAKKKKPNRKLRSPAASKRLGKDPGRGKHSAFEEVAVELQRTRRTIARGWRRKGAVAAEAVPPHLVTIVAEGDSWFDYPFNDVVDCLDDRGYDIHSVARMGHLIEDMAHAQLPELVAKIMKRKPRFLLLSGGGNDIAGPELAMLVNHRESHLAKSGERLRPPVVQYVFHNVFRDAYRRIIETSLDAAKKAGVERLDILGHGYSPPFADGRPAYWFFGPWLKPPLEKRGYTKEVERNTLMAELIGEFNAMVENLADDYPGQFHYLNLQPMLPRKADWANELHPSQSRFVDVARVFSDRMQEILSTA